MKHKIESTPTYAEEQLEYLEEQEKTKVEVVTPDMTRLPAIPIPPDDNEGGGGRDFQVCPFIKGPCITERCMMWLADRTMPHGSCAIIISAKAALSSARSAERAGRPKPPRMRM